MSSESQIEKNVVRFAKEEGCYVRKFKAPGNRGVPDKLFLAPNGIVFFIEFKKPTGVLSAMQKDEIAQIKKRKGNVFVVDNVPDGRAIVQSILLQ
jgi:hypothetical protein